MTQEKETIVRKIKKALALAENNPNENEAKSAMLHAQRLMAQHNIEMFEFEDVVKGEVIEDGGIYQRRVWWRSILATTIANNFKCDHFNRTLGGKTSIVFVGRKEDVDVCMTVYDFAERAVEYFSKEYLKKRKKELEKQFNFKDEETYNNLISKHLSRDEIRQLNFDYPDPKLFKMRAIMQTKKRLGIKLDSSAIKNDYIQGFLRGLRDQFQEQKKSNEEEWGLVLVKDPEIKDYLDNLGLKKAASSLAKSGVDPEATKSGYEKGKSWSSPKGEVE